MKIYPCVPRPLAVRLGLIAALSFGIASVGAQPGSSVPDPAGNGAARTARAQGNNASSSLFDIEIAGGKFLWKGKTRDATLENVVDLLRERHEAANIVLSPHAPRITIPNLKLRATSLEQELEALRVASGNEFIWSKTATETGPALGVPVPGVPSAPGATPAPPPDLGYNDKVPLYIISELPPNLAPPGPRVEAFNLTDYFNSLGGDEETHDALVSKNLTEIDQIIRSTLQMTDDPQIQIKFHSGANLLVVVGSPRAIDVASKVVNALGPRPGTFNPATGFPAPGFARTGGFGGGMPVSSASAAASNKARRAILNKLESIRVETISFDNLPLSEIVRRLRDEAKKLDPDKRGINFLVNPTQPPVASGPNPMPPAVDPVTGVPIVAGPAEMVDINSVAIKIVPPLTNVRLVDVLDAMMKTADHPLKYTISDYAVVFSLRGPGDGGETPGVF